MEKQNRAEWLKKLIAITKDICCDENLEITEQTQIKTFLDSLDVMELTCQLEKHLPKQITDSSVEAWNTFGDILDTILIISEDE